MSSANNLVNPQVSASGEAATLTIEKFEGQVREQYITSENLLNYFEMGEVTGTNTISNKYIGETEVQGMGAGVSVQGEEVEFDKNALVIDKAIFARNMIGTLSDVQDDINTKGRLASNQIKQMKKVEDRFILHTLIRGARIRGEDGGDYNVDGGETTPRVKGHRFAHDVSISQVDANDPWLVLCAIELLIEKKLEDEIDDDGMCVVTTWAHFNAMRDLERIVNMDYQTFAGDTRKGFVLKSFNLPVIPSNRFPKVGQDLQKDSKHHLLSSASNNYRYDVTANDELAIAVVFGRDAIMAGRSIDLQGDIWFNKDNKTWYCDTWMSEGAIDDRWEALGVITARPTGAKNSDAVKARKARKATLTQAIA